MYLKGLPGSLSLWIFNSSRWIIDLAFEDEPFAHKHNADLGQRATTADAIILQLRTESVSLVTQDGCVGSQTFQGWPPQPGILLS